MIFVLRQRMPLLKVLTFVVALALVVQFADARVYKGSMKTKNNWQFVAKFCFDGKPGGLNGTLSWNVPSPNQPNRKLLMYWDQPQKGKQGSWVTVYKNKQLTCQQKSDANHTASGGIRNLYDEPMGTTTALNNYKHYWWVVLADCSVSTQDISSYYIQFLQSSGSQLSCDEEGASLTSLHSPETRFLPSAAHSPKFETDPIR